MPRLTDSNDYLLCPEPDCSLPDWTHIESIVARTRPREDGPVTYHRVCMSGEVTPPSSDWHDDPFDYTGDRRDSVIIMATCEAGHTFAIRLRQNRGQTEVETKSKAWR